MSTSMSGSDSRFQREEAVLSSAVFLRDWGTAFFPLDIRRLCSFFGRQITLIPYSGLKRSRFCPSGVDMENPLSVSREGFCFPIPNALLLYGRQSVETAAWCIAYNDALPEARIRFTLGHELGHIVLAHPQRFGRNMMIGLENHPDYPAAERHSDAFSVNLLAPVPAVLRVLREHGFSWSGSRAPAWQLTDRGAPFLRNLGCDPDPKELLKTAFGLSDRAAAWRLSELHNELEIWKRLDPGLYEYLEKLPHRAGWYCSVCGTRRRTSSLYCPGCGSWMRYAYRDMRQFPKPTVGLKENGQFAFCSVCGNSGAEETDPFCSVCGSPLFNDCENASHPDGDFIRGGMPVIRGTHHCRPSDIYCGTCGALTAFGRRHGPRENMWLPNPGSARCRMAGTAYPEELPAENGRLTACPSCGSPRTMRGGRFCAECMQPLENACVPEGGPMHACGVQDRFCRQCGSPTRFFQSGFLTDYRLTEAYALLLKAEKKRNPARPRLLMIQPDGRVRNMEEESR